jgi:hypothetical protein
MFDSIDRREILISKIEGELEKLFSEIKSIDSEKLWKMERLESRNLAQKLSGMAKLLETRTLYQDDIDHIQSTEMWQ